MALLVRSALTLSRNRNPPQCSLALVIPKADMDSKQDTGCLHLSTRRAVLKHADNNLVCPMIREGLGTLKNKKTKGQKPFAQHETHA